MTPWAPVPLSLLFDLRVRPLSWAERGVLHHIHLIAAASPHGITAAVEKRTGEADATAWKRALGEDGATHLGRLIEGGWFTICPAGVRVATTPTQTAPRAPAGAPTTRGDTHHAEMSEGAHAATPDAAARLRKLRYAFKHRLGEFAQVDPATSWEAWSGCTQPSSLGTTVGTRKARPATPARRSPRASSAVSRPVPLHVR